MQNYVQSGEFINVACSHPAAPASGDPVRVGDFCGVAVTKEGEGDNATGETTVLTEGVVTVTVNAVNAGGNSAVALGDKIYYVDADTPVLSKKTSGKFFGYALGTVTSGNTGAIPVMLAN